MNRAGNVRKTYQWGAFI